jgi:predicted DCC family thiol-disulfide oxidoreductase YuxK
MTEIKERPSPNRLGGLESAAAWEQPSRGWILYDADCRPCTRSAKALERVFSRRGFHFLPLQTPWVQERLGLHPGAPLEEMRVLTNDGCDFGGGDAVIFLARQMWWTWPFFALANFPGAHRIFDLAYCWIAAHRACTLKKRRLPGRRVKKAAARKLPPLLEAQRASSRLEKLLGGLPLILLPTLALLARNKIASWQFMWLMAGAIFLGCKWVTFWRARSQNGDLSIGRALGYFFGWPGMDAVAFVAPRQRKKPIPAYRIVIAVAKIAFGFLLLFYVAAFASNPLLAGWMGMIGFVLILHFGIFDLTGLAWRNAGIDVKPIMNAPIRATSLNEFWAQRWNGAFNLLVVELFFRRCSRSVGTVPATLTAFLISGLLHELVISLPARADYGLPTAYFLLQACGVIAQRRFGIRRGFAGWLSTMTIAAGPAFWLFHPPFVRQVILPFMHTIHAL